jgi:polyhydroxyalkanoate synthesis regulator phasin
MKTYVCVVDRVFFNKRIYNFGEHVNMDEELAKTVNSKWFEPKETYDEKQKVVTTKIKTAEKSGKTIKEVISEAEAEKRKMAQDYEAKINSLEKQLNPKVKQ